MNLIKRVLKMNLIKRVLRKLIRRRVDDQVSDQNEFCENLGFKLPGFKIDVQVPNGEKRLFIGENSMVAGRFIFESSTGSVMIAPKSYIGGSVFISRSKIEIGSNVFIAWGCTIYDHDSHSLDYLERRKDIQRQIEDLKADRNFIMSKNWEVDVQELGGSEFKAN